MGSAANAVKTDIIPYFDSMLTPLQAYLTMQHNEETQVFSVCFLKSETKLTVLYEPFRAVNTL